MKIFKNMDKTKRWLLIFIIVIFVGIGGISLYRSFQPNQDKDYITRTDIANQKDEDQKTDTQPTTQEKTETKKQQETPEKKETSKESSSKSKEKDNQDNTKKESTKEEPKEQLDQPIVENNNISINIEVKGINENFISQTVDVKKGSTAFSVLKEVATQKQMKVTTSGFGTMVYVTGIGDLKEKQYGNSSGWVYKVNDVSPNKSAGSYELKDGDRVQWYYVYENNED